MSLGRLNKTTQPRRRAGMKKKTKAINHPFLICKGVNMAIEFNFPIFYNPSIECFPFGKKKEGAKEKLRENEESNHGLAGARVYASFHLTTEHNARRQSKHNFIQYSRSR